MSRRGFTAFLQTRLAHAAGVCRDGAIAFVCMDWRHMGELLAAGEPYSANSRTSASGTRPMAAWAPSIVASTSWCSCSRSAGAATPTPSGWASTGRYRTNVWDYAGVNTLRSGRMEELAMHPTVKPVALVADAIRDCSRRGELVLDPFGGSGTTLIAAQKTGRRARLIEYDPAYCDQALRPLRTNCRQAAPSRFQWTGVRKRWPKSVLRWQRDCSQPAQEEGA